MVQHNEDRPNGEAVELLNTNGFEGLAGEVTVLPNSATLALRSEHLGAGVYERSSARYGYANGFEDKSLETRFRTM